MSLDVSVIVLSHDHWSYTETALRGLARSQDVQFETIVVDNGSKPAVVAALERLATSELGDQLRLRYLLSEDNLGVARGRNLGAGLASAPLVLFLDNDVEVIDEGWLAVLVNSIRTRPEFGVISAVLANADAERTTQFAGGTVDSRGRVAFQVELNPDRSLSERILRTTFCLGACLLTPRSLFEQCGGFDEVFDPMDYEDIDYCLRVSRLGRQSGVVLDSRIVHHGHVTTGRQDFDRLRSYLANGRRFVRRWAGRLEGDGGPPLMLPIPERSF